MSVVQSAVRDELYLCDANQSLRGKNYRLELDGSRSDGMPRRLLDVSQHTALGKMSDLALCDRFTEMYRWFNVHEKGARSGSRH